MRHVKHLFITALMFCLLFALSIPVAAEETSQGAGSISLKLVAPTGEAAGGGTLLIYKVASLEVNGDQLTSYTFTDEFKTCGYSLKRLESLALVEKLQDFITRAQISGRLLEVNDKGEVKVENLSNGIYLVEQLNSAVDFEPMKPFLVTVPMHVDGKLVYDVDASPKTEVRTTGEDVTTEHPKTPPSDDDTPPGGGSGGGGGSSSKLPKTGQLWWPVPVLAILGILLFSTGWRRRKNEE